MLDNEQVADGSLRARDDVLVSRSAPVTPGSEPYTVALASRQSLPSPPGRVVIAGAADLSLKSQLAYAEAVNASLTKERDRARTDVATLESVEATLRSDNGTLMAELEALRNELRNVYGSLSWRMTRPLRGRRRLRRR